MQQQRILSRISVAVLLGMAAVVDGQGNVGVGGFVSTEQCFPALITADMNGDGQLDSEEYVVYVQNFGPPGFASDVTRFQDLPLSLQGAFTALACLCEESGGGAECCVGPNANIPINGTSPGDNPSNAQLTLLYTVCVTTQTAIENVLGTIAPTTVPPTFTPSLSPTQSPTVQPTLSPTLFPTDGPSATPTIKQSDVPSVAPVTPAPTTGASAMPSILPTQGPSVEPSVSPSRAISDVPTSAPVTPAPTTLAPSSVPSLVPSSGPTSTPSLLPTMAGSDIPSAAPVTPGPTSVVPSTAPTTLPSALPSVAPVTLSPATQAPVVPTTIAPGTAAPVTLSPAATQAPVVPTTIAPGTVAPVTLSPAATQAPVVPTTIAPGTAVPVTAAPITPVPTTTMNVLSTVNYDIAIMNGVTSLPANIDQELIAAMDSLATQVATEVFPPPAVRRRRLVVTVSTPSSVGGILNIPCPSDVPTTDLCQRVPATVTLMTNENPVQVQANFTSGLNRAILDGRLQESLSQTSPSTSVYLLTGRSLTPSSAPVAASSRLGDTYILLLSLGGVVTGAAMVALFFVGRRGGPVDTRKKPEPLEIGVGQDTDEAVSRDPFVGPTAGSSEQVGISPADYGRKRNKSAKVVQTLEEVDVVDKAPPATGAVDEGADSSYAGDSGWSSSLGQSSAHTGSVDSLDFGGGQAAGASLAAIGAASAIAADTDEREAVPDVPRVTRDDLDQAIEAGDWAAVGATAALLAAASDSQSQSSRSRRSGASFSRDGTSISSLDAARAAELDHLVDAGDWEGVVLAAAKFEASEDTSTNASATIGSSHHTGTSGSQSTSLSESPSKVARRDEIREEVEALVRRVVPEEIDNVDEMMLQFKGREEELVETLRTMQERQLAQIARVQGQKQAKRDARRTAQQGGIDLPRPGATESGEEVSASTAAGIGLGVAAAAGVAAGVAAAEGVDEASDLSDDEDVARAPVQGSDSGSGGRRRTELETAIEAGDWEAVGAAAAMLSDTSVTSGSSLGGDTTSADGGYRIDADRAAQLDAMIDRGDWTGVVAAASRFSGSEGAGDSETGRSTFNTTDSSSRGATVSSSAGTSSGQPDSDQRMQDEQEEALAQAEIWMQIAEQSKQEGGTTNAGASSAADWAIERSLSALRQAEETGELRQGKSEEGEVSISTVGEEGSQDRSV